MRITPPVPGVDAVTRTGVLAIPEVTVTTTVPSLAEMPVVDDKVMPPVVVLNPNVTVLPLIGFPAESNTLKVTTEEVLLPLPNKEILVGEEEMYCIEPTTGAKTVRDAEEEGPPLTEATTVSVPAQPLSRYEPVATPFTVTTLPNTALPLVPQPELNVTVCGVVTFTPPLCTLTVMLVVPKAEREEAPTPKTGVVTVTEAAPTE